MQKKLKYTQNLLAIVKYIQIKLTKHGNTKIKCSYNNKLTVTFNVYIT